jgi:flagellar hook-length control protein FliK
MNPFMSTVSIQTRADFIPAPEKTPGRDEPARDSGFDMILRSRIESRDEKPESRDDLTARNRDAAPATKEPDAPVRNRETSRHDDDKSRQDMAAKPHAPEKTEAKAEKKDSGPEKTGSRADIRQPKTAAQAENRELHVRIKSRIAPRHDEPDITKILAHLQGLLNMNFGNPVKKRQVTEAVKDISRELLKPEISDGKNHNVLKARTKRLLDVLDKLTDRVTKNDPKVAQIVKDLNALLEKQAPRGEKKSADMKERLSALINQNEQKENANIPTGRAVVHESPSSMKNDTGTESRGGMNFSFQRNDSMKAQNSQMNIPQARSQVFNEQLQSVIDNARIYVRNSQNGTFQVRLNPRELGSINVNLGLEQGVLHGRFLVDSNEARDILFSNLSGIRQQLEDAGVSVGEFHVNVRDQGQSGQKENEESVRYTKLPSEKKEMQNVYESSAMSSHNGAINMVI